MSHSKWQANKYKASRCPIFSDMSVKAILLLHTDSTGRLLLADELSSHPCVYQLTAPGTRHQPLLRRLELLPNLTLNPLLIALRCVYQAVYLP